MSLSMSYLRESNKAQRRKRESLCLARDYLNNTETWRNVPETKPHGAPFMFKSVEAAAMMLRMGSETIGQMLSPAEHELFFETLNLLEQRVQLISPFLSRTIVIEGPQGCGVSTLIKGLTCGTTGSNNIWKGILDCRIKLQLLPSPLLSAFESACDYCRIVDAEESPSCAAGESFVFIERLYHSRVAHTLCKYDIVTDFTSLPPSTFSWPKDLPIPILVVYLVVPHEVRNKRSLQSPISLEEYENIQQMHSLVTGGPEIIGIDASGSPEDVIETVLQCCDTYGLNIRNPSLNDCGRRNINYRGGTTDDKNGCDDYEKNDSESGMDQPLFINFSDVASMRRSDGGTDGRRGSNSRQSMGWYGAFISTNREQ